MSNWQYGWRFLNGAGGTNPTNKNREHYSVLPRPDEKWSDWTVHPTPLKPDGKDCGPGRLHIMCKPSALYAPTNWYIWYARWLPENEVGRSKEKVSVTQYQLRRIRPTVFWRIIRLGWCSRAYLSRADLSEANLRGANLLRANLSGASLSDANLSGADLSEANLRGANLPRASLFYANLSRVNLLRANLSGASLSDANLSGADLSEANLRGADLSRANLYGANLSNADLSGADLSEANLSRANLSRANLSDAIINEYTVLPIGFDKSRLEANHE